MSITCDQLRAARVLLHLQQMQLAKMSRVSLSTIRRFEQGTDIGFIHADALRRTLVEAGALFIDGADPGAGMPAGVVGVVLRPKDDLPAETRARIEAGRASDPGASGGAGSESTNGGDARDATSEAVDDAAAPGERKPRRKGRRLPAPV